MKGWVGLVGWPVADGLPTLVVTHQLQVERRTGKVCQLETNVLPLCHATNCYHTELQASTQQHVDMVGVQASANQRPAPTHTHTLHDKVKGFLDMLNL